MGKIDYKTIHNRLPDLNEGDYKHLTANEYVVACTGDSIRNSSCILSGGDFTDLGTGSIRIDAGTLVIRETNSSTANLISSSFNQTDIELTDQDTSYIYAEYDNGTGLTTIKATVTKTPTINGNNAIPLGKVYREGTSLNLYRDGYNFVDFQKKVNQRFNTPNEISLLNGGLVSESDPLELAVTGATLFGGVNKQTTSAIDTSGTDTFEYYKQKSGGGFEYISQTATTLNNTQYDNAGTLTSLSTNNYRVDFSYLNFSGELLVLIGNTQYNKLVDAQVATPPTTLPEHISEFSTLLARIIVQEGEANIIEIDNRNAITFSTSGTIVHNETTSLQGGTTDEYYHLTASEYTNLKKESMVIVVGDETTDITTGAAKLTFRMPYAFTLDDVRASVNTAPTGANLVVDINEGGTSVLSTELSIDAGEKTSTTATTEAVISDSSLADDSEITVDIDQVGSTVAGKGLKVVLIGRRV
jgi:hypothetical protein